MQFGNLIADGQAVMVVRRWVISPAVNAVDWLFGVVRAAGLDTDVDNLLASAA